MDKTTKSQSKDAPAKPPETKKPGLEVRKKDGCLVYSVGDMDLLSRDPAHPHFYVLLADCPQFGYVANTVRVLGAPFDDNALSTARDMARSLGLLE